MHKFKPLILLIAIAIIENISCLNPAINNWKNSTGYGAGAFSNIRANVLKIYYTSNYVYINANSIPSYAIGPWSHNPNNATAQNFIYSFPLNPTSASTKKATGLGAIGLFTNGVEMYNAMDGNVYNTYWYRNAYMIEGISFDKCNGHPDPNGNYHNHANPVCLYDSTKSTAHSPIIGWALDGFPVYGAFGYSNANNVNSAIKRLLPSYVTRSYANNQRTSLPNGTQLGSQYYGPNVNSTYPIGYYLQDYQYVKGAGDLDEYNGRFSKTPEYPNGIYAYFIATNSR
jgi:hypothetical protein